MAPKTNGKFMWFSPSMKLKGLEVEILLIGHGCNAGNPVNGASKISGVRREPTDDSDQSSVGGDL
jgi:hypothetical protein